MSGFSSGFVGAGRFGGGGGGGGDEGAAALRDVRRSLERKENIGVESLQRVVSLLNAGPGGNQRQWEEANEVLVLVRQDVDAWQGMDAVLEGTEDLPTRLFALSVLEDVAKYRWEVVPEERRLGIRGWVISAIVDLAEPAYEEEELARAARAAGERPASSPQRQFLGRINMLLVLIVKRDWPSRWPSFLEELLASAEGSVAHCANAMDVLRLLSEDVFEFGREELQSTKGAELQEQMTTELGPVLDLIGSVLADVDAEVCLSATLRCLERLLVWVPEGFIFESGMLEMLVRQFLPEPAFRSEALRCLTQVAQLNFERYEKESAEMFVGAMQHLSTAIPPDAPPEEIARVHDEAVREGSSTEPELLLRVALFATSFLEHHVRAVAPDAPEEVSEAEPCLVALQYLVGITAADDRELLRICVDFWRWFSRELYKIQAHYAPAPSKEERRGGGGGGGVGGGERPMSAALSAVKAPQVAVFDDVLAQLRRTLVQRMARPQEFILTTDDEGMVVRDLSTDTEEVELYRRMREVFVYLTHLDAEDMQNTLLDGLRPQISVATWSHDGLSRICWAVGCVSGTLRQVDETKFVVTVIRDLLTLVDHVENKGDKAIIAGSIMYVVGQYPRFLRAHWKFLRTVAKKLFEFMRETHPGVQDMAVDTFLKIARACRRSFAEPQDGEEPFLLEIARTTPDTTQKLEPYQEQTFFEAAGNIIAAAKDPVVREEWIELLLEPPAQVWRQIVDDAAEFGEERLVAIETIKDVSRVMRVLARVAKATALSFARHMGAVFLDMLHVYKSYAGALRSLSEERGGLNRFEARYLRTARRDMLRLCEVFVMRAGNEHEGNPRLVNEEFVSKMLEVVVTEMEEAPPELQEPRALSLIMTIVSTLGPVMEEGVVADVLNSCFSATLPLITANQEDNPEHRAAFFRLLEAANKFTFPALLQMSPEHRKHITDAIVWAVRHAKLDIAETGLQTLLEFVFNVEAAGVEVAAPFFGEYLLPLVRDLLDVLSDGMHTSNFAGQAGVLRQLCLLVAKNKVEAPLWEDPIADTPEEEAVRRMVEEGVELDVAEGGNADFFIEVVAITLGHAFPNLTREQIVAFSQGLLEHAADKDNFRTHLRDFLIEAVEWTNTDAKREMYRSGPRHQGRDEQERAVPGLAFKDLQSTLGPAATMALQEENDMGADEAAFGDDAGLLESAVVLPMIDEDDDDV